MCCVVCAVLQPLGSCSPVCHLRVLCCVCGVLGHIASVHRCARSVSCIACTVSLATWLLFTGVPARSVVLHVRCPWPLGSCSRVCTLGVLCVWCPWPLGSCSPVCPLGVLCCVCGVLGHLAPVHWSGRSVCCVASAVSFATWLLWTSGPLGVLCCVGGVPSLLAPVHRSARSVCFVACAVSLATWLLFTGVPGRCVVLRVRRPWPLGSCSPVCTLTVFCCVSGVLDHLAPVHRCARLVCCVACGVFLATWPLFTGVHAPCAVCAVSLATWLLCPGVPARSVVLCVRCPPPLGFCAPVCPLGVLCCVSGVFGHLAPVHRSARSVCCVACALSLATWLLFTVVHAPCSVCAVSLATWLLFPGVPARCVVLCVRCPWPLGSCVPVCPLSVLCCGCGVLGHLAPVHRCARSVCCVSGVLGHLVPVHRCARSVFCVACSVSMASWLLFTALPAPCVVLRLRCPWPLGSCSLVYLHGLLCVRCPWPLVSCSPVCPVGVSCCVCGVLGRLAPVQRCARSLSCVVCAVPLATWLLLTGVHARRADCAVSLAIWLLFTAVPAPCVVLRLRCPWPLSSCSLVYPHSLLCVRCPWPLSSCSTVYALRVLCCVCAVLGHLAPVQRCAPSLSCIVSAVPLTSWLLLTGVHARCADCAVSLATWLLITAARARCVVLRVRFP